MIQLYVPACTRYFDTDYHDSLEFPVVKLKFLKTDEVLKGGATSETDFCYFFE